VIGVIGGTGIYELGGLLEGSERIEMETPFGKPSGTIVRGRLSGKEVCFLPRHGAGHVYTPSEVPYAANIWALKSLGVKFIISLSAVGSLKLEHRPMDFVIVTQFIDRTFQRRSTFFGDGIVAHIPFAHPVSEDLGRVILAAGKALDPPLPAITMGGTYVCMEGPAFSTRAESDLYRSWGASVIGMTNLTEAKLAREAEIAYSTVALVTDYDCWHEGVESVSVEAVSKVLRDNASNALRLVKAAVAAIDPAAAFPEHTALQGAICTAPEKIPAKIRQKLDPIVRRVL
jgi:5'-methylthioadenosine phosphorylase